MKNTLTLAQHEAVRKSDSVLLDIQAESIKELRKKNKSLQRTITIATAVGVVALVVLAYALFLWGASQ